MNTEQGERVGVKNTQNLVHVVCEWPRRKHCLLSNFEACKPILMGIFWVGWSFLKSELQNKFWIEYLLQKSSWETVSKFPISYNSKSVPWPSLGSLGTLHTIALCWCSYFASPEEVSINSWVCVSTVPKNLSSPFT